MSKQFQNLEAAHIAFIQRQKIFFNASAAAEGRVNVSPRDAKSLRILDANTVAYLDLTGSGNETAAHLRANGRLTLMFCSFEGPPMILRLYGQGRVVRRASTEYASQLASHFAGLETLGARQMVFLAIDLVQTSCGFNVPLFDYAEERDTFCAGRKPKALKAWNTTGEQRTCTALMGLPPGCLRIRHLEVL